MASKDLSLLGNIDEKVLECSICNERLEDPKSLNCHHSFCLKCLEKWVNTNNGELTCPTCRESHTIPVGGLQKLAPNTLINNLIEIIQRHESTYCNKLFDMIDELETNPALSSDDECMDLSCPSYTEPLEMYCTKCKVPIHKNNIQMKCIMSWDDGKHELITIGNAFQIFKESSEELTKAANESIQKMENVLKVVAENVSKLEENVRKSLADIDNTVQQMVQTIQQKGDEMKKRVEEIYKNEKECYEVQIEKMLKNNSELNKNLNFLNELLKSEPSNAMKSSEFVLKSLQGKIDTFKEIEDSDSRRQINFIRNKLLPNILKKSNIGEITPIYIYEDVSYKYVMYYCCRMASKDISLLGEIDEKVLECSICSGRLEDPKSLSCHHSFCLKCLDEWVQTNHGKLTCPTCRKSYPIPEGGPQKLAPNTLLNNLLETVKQHEINDKNECTALLCPFHTQPLQMYCTKCKEPVCIECTEAKHAAEDGKHELVNIVTAFKMFKESSEELKTAANESIHKMENVLKVVTENVSKLENSKRTSLAVIDNTVQEMVQTIHQKGDEMKKKVEEIYKNEMEGYDVQMEKIEKINSELNTNLNFLHKLLNSEPSNAMKSSKIVLNTLKDQTNKSEEIKRNDSKRQINFVRNKHLTDILKESNIGNITPLAIRLEENPCGIAKCDDDCLLVSFGTNEIHKYQQSGEYLNKIRLPRGVEVKRLYTMKNDHIAFCDNGNNNKCIQICDMNGHVIKFIGKGVLENPWGIHIDESANVIYVTDLVNIACVFVFDISSGKMLEKIKNQNKPTSQYLDVTLTRTGNVLVADLGNDQVLFYDNMNKKLKMFINKGDEDGNVRLPHEIVVDRYGNIIISSCGKLQLFSSDGYFIKRIDQGKNEIEFPNQLCIISYNPCMVAIATSFCKILILNV
ncbi:uncharacterized protein [Antedon mediterranea]|uniref:uncharacterized protein n=1 Tax=Antedon mediterranea TaxID=105859 RepID=UPI003AF90337